MKKMANVTQKLGFRLTSSGVVSASVKKESA
jgi:hypothetical protein